MIAADHQAIGHGRLEITGSTMTEKQGRRGVANIFTYSLQAIRPKP